jgi:Kelch motif/Galactose oxidase, central domain
MAHSWKFLVGAALITGVAASGLGRLTGGPANADLRAQPLGGRLVSTADMQVGRASHTATALPDGRVLVAGGFIEKGSSKGAEVYEPDKGSYAPLPPMVTTRHSHTATLLPDGKVLIAGGYGEGTVTLAAAELFDPEQNTFAPTGSLHAARADHIAVPLKDGKVLIAGGLGPGWTFLSSAEVYDPVTGRFSPTGSMTMSRESHAAVRLLDGRVLIVGGHSGQRRNLTILASTEIYDPATGAFGRAGAMRVPRHKHDAVLLPAGQVLITGGADERDDRGVYDSTELFDPKTGMFVAGPVMKLGRYKQEGSSVVLPSGLVLISGGAPQAETYDAASRSFALVPGEPRMAGQFSAVALLRGGGALITGGYGNGTGPRSSAWLYRP